MLLLHYISLKALDVSYFFGFVYINCIYSLVRPTLKITLIQKMVINSFKLVHMQRLLIIFTKCTIMYLIGTLGTDVLDMFQHYDRSLYRSWLILILTWTHLIQVPSLSNLCLLVSINGFLPNKLYFFCKKSHHTCTLLPSLAPSSF